VDNINSLKRSRSVSYNPISKIYCFVHYENFVNPYKIGRIYIKTTDKLEIMTNDITFKPLILNGEYLNHIRGKPIIIPFKTGFLCIFQTHDDDSKYSNIYCQEITTDISGAKIPTKIGELRSITYFGFEPSVAISKNMYNEENILITWLELPQEKKGFPVSFSYNGEMRLRGKIFTHKRELKPNPSRGGDFLIPLETGINALTYDVQHANCIGINNQQQSTFLITGTDRNSINNKTYLLKTAVFKFMPNGGYIDYYTKKSTGQLLFDKSGSLSTHKRLLDKIYFPENNIFPEKSIVMASNGTGVCILFHRKIKNSKNENVLQLIKIEADNNGFIPLSESQGIIINETICEKDSFNPQTIALNKNYIIAFEKCIEGVKPSIEVESINSHLNINSREYLKKQMHKKMRNMRFDLLKIQ
jgi:hypothetical protein